MSHLRTADGTILCDHDEPHELATPPADSLSTSTTTRSSSTTLVILRITWESWQTVSKTEPGEMLDEHAH